MNREDELRVMYKEVENYFKKNNLIDEKVDYKFIPGSWIKSKDGFEYRFDICDKCGTRYVNKRPRNVQYGIHNWWHYCSKRICSKCCDRSKSGINPPPSLQFERIIKK